MMIRERAQNLGTDEVAHEKLAIINLSLGVILRRYKASRKQRRNEVGGEFVQTEENND